MAKLKHWLIDQKFRIDLGFQLWPLINFTLLIIAISDKLARFIGVENTHVLVLFIVPCAFIAVWLFGYILDKLHYQQGSIYAQNRRNPNWDLQVWYYNEILKRLK